MLTVRISTALLSLMFLPAFWQGPSTLEGMGSDFGRIAGHKVLAIHESVFGDHRSLDLAVPLVLFQDPRAIYWVGTVTGLFSFDEGANHWTASIDESGQSPGRFAQTIAWSSDGKLWVRSLMLHYLKVFDGNRWRQVESIGGLKLEPSGPLLTSNSGKIWLAQKSGVYLYDNGKWQGPVIPPARLEQLFNLYSDKKSSGRNASGKRSSMIRFVAVGIEDRSGDLWMGTRSAVVRFSTGNQSWALYRLPRMLSGVLNVYEDAMGRIWFCDTKGVAAQFDKANASWSVHNLPEALRRNNPQSPFNKFSVNGICQDKTGQVLFATDVGLISFRETSDEWNLYTLVNSALPDNEVSSLLVDKAGKIWIGTGKGVVVLDP